MTMAKKPIKIIKLRTWDVFGNILKDIPITSIERHPKGIKKGWVRINLANGQHAILQKTKLRENII